MDINLHGIDELKNVVEEFKQVASRLSLTAKTMMMAAEKIDDAMAAHIGSMTTFMEANNGLPSTGETEADVAGAGPDAGLGNDASGNGPAAVGVPESGEVS